MILVAMAREGFLLREVSMEQALQEIREWLRMHGDYHVNIDVWGLYGCYVVVVKRLDQTLVTYAGMNLEKHLCKALDYLRAIEGK